MELNIKIETLKAALEAAATKYSRYCLNGVLIEVTAPDTAFVVATDGGMLFAARVPVSCEQTGYPFRIIIPRDAVKAAKSGALRSLDDGRYSLGDVIFTPVDGVYPDWRRVIPTQVDMCSKGQPGQFDAELLYRAQKALRLHHGLKGGIPYLEHNGAWSATMTMQDNTAIVVIMPWRCTESAWRFVC